MMFDGLLLEITWMQRPRPFAVPLEQTGKLVPHQSVIQLTFQ
jgi:hypothetical protein